MPCEPLVKLPLIEHREDVGAYPGTGVKSRPDEGISTTKTSNRRRTRRAIAPVNCRYKTSHYSDILGVYVKDGGVSLQ